MQRSGNFPDERNESFSAGFSSAKRLSFDWSMKEAIRRNVVNTLSAGVGPRGIDSGRFVRPASVRGTDSVQIEMKIIVCCNFAVSAGFVETYRKILISRVLIELILLSF